MCVRALFCRPRACVFYTESQSLTVCDVLLQFDRDSNSIGWMAPGKPKTLKSIPLSSITGVTRGRKTELLRRRGKSSRDRFYFSLIGV